MRVHTEGGRYTPAMYGYEPPNPMRPGGCRETLVLIRVAFEVLTPILGAGVGALGLLALTFWLFTQHVALGLIPVALVVVGLVLLARRDKRVQEQRERETRWPD